MRLKAYHGTTKINSDKILTNDFKQKVFLHNPTYKNDLPGDLGVGIYGFLDDAELALAFASKSVDVKDCAVIEMDIDVHEDNLIDFDDDHNLKQFLQAKKKVMNLAKTYLKNCKGRRNCIDGIVIELLIQKTQMPAKVIKKRTYTPLPDEHIDSASGGKIQPISNYYNGTEICIRDKGVISQKMTLK